MLGTKYVNLLRRGLGIKILGDINLALLVKVAFIFLAFKDDLSLLLYHKFFNYDGDKMKCYRKSSIWPGIARALVDIKVKI